MGHESGNAFWFILLAIALLAALTITISRTSDTTEQSGDTERLRIQSSDVLRYAADIEKNIERMRLRGISENDFSFDNTITAASYVNPNCSAGDSCLLFSRTGVGMTYKPIGLTEWLFTGDTAVSGVGTASPELLMILPEIDQSLCDRINTEIGIAGIPADTGAISLAMPFTGVFSAPGVTTNAAPGKKAGCFEGNQDENTNNISGKYYYYHTLIPR